MDNKLNLTVNFLGVDKLSGSLKNIIGIGKTGAQSLKGMKDQARGLERELGDVRREIAKGSGNMTQLINRERELTAATAAANKQLERKKNNLSRIAIADKIERRGQQLKTSGRDNIVQGATLLAPLLLAVKAAGDFDDGMIDIRQKADLTAAQTMNIRNDIVAAARAAKQMPESLRQGVDTLIGAGLGSDIAAQMIAPIGKAATAYRAEVDDLAKTSFSNFQNLKVPVDQTAQAINIMAQAGKEGNFEINEMAQHFPALTAQAQTLGQTGVSAVADLSAALQIARRGAGDSASAAVNIQNLLTAINTERTINKFKDFGIDLPAAMKKAEREGRTPLEAIAMLTKKATGGDLSKIPLLMGSQQAQKALAPLINDFDDYLAIREKSANATGVIDSDFEIRSKGASANLRVMMGSMSELALVAGNHLLPTAIKVVDGMAGIIQTTAKWADENPRAASAILKIVAAAGLFKIGLGALQMVFGSFLVSGAKIFKFFSIANAAGVTRFATVLGLLKSGAMIAGRAVLFLGRALMMNPIGIIVTAIGVAAYLIYTHWDTIKAAFFNAVAWLGQAWALIQNRFNEGINFISGLGGRMVGIGRNVIMGLAQGIMNSGSAVWNALKSVVTGGIANVKNLLGIKSPSRLFMGLGDFMSQGMALGIERGGRKAISSAGKMAAEAAAAGSLAIMPAMASPSGPASAAAGAAGAAAGASVIMHVTIKIDGAGGDAMAQAKDIKTKLDELAGVAARGDFSDE